MSSHQSLRTESRSLAYQQMITACQTGNRIQLKKLVSEDILNKADGYLAWRLREAAVKRRNSSIVSFFLQTYPETGMKSEPVLKAAFNHSLKVLHAFDPSIVTNEFNPWATAFLESWRFGDPTIPNFPS